MTAVSDAAVERGGASVPTEPADASNPPEDSSMSDVTEPPQAQAINRQRAAWQAGPDEPEAGAEWLRQCDVSATCNGDVMVVSSNGMPAAICHSPNPVPVDFNADLPIDPEVAAEKPPLPSLVRSVSPSMALYTDRMGEFPDPYGDPQLNAITDASGPYCQCLPLSCAQGGVFER